MLIQFTVGNSFSFREKVTLSMVKTALHELPENVIQADKDIALLKSAVVYGANASGKSNLMKALFFMRFFGAFSSAVLQIDDPILTFPFLLNEGTSAQPSFFEIVCIIDKVVYRYGFEVGDRAVNKEWLYHTPKAKEEELFYRVGADIRISGGFAEGKGVEQKTRANCSFLSVVAQFNGQIASKIVKWFKRFHVNVNYNYPALREHIIDRMENDPSLKEGIIKFVSIADNGIADFKIESATELPAQTGKNISREGKGEVKRHSVLFKHKTNNIKKQEGIDLPVFLESEGTKKMFALSVPVIDAIKNGEIMIIDELENHLHPLLLKYIIKLFNSHANRNNAQLIFTTHNLTCMDKEFFRRDQIWFTEKNASNESTLFSLAEYKIQKKKIRNDASFSKDYLLGKYGAVPFIADIDLSFKENSNE